MNIARLIYETFLGFDTLDIDPDKDCKDLATLYNTVISMSPGTLGDSLFRFVVVEAYEGGVRRNGSISIPAVIRVLERGKEDLDAVINALDAMNE